ncbi:hypothetical protein Poly30_42890 [Planctomycetes bacterium Poly30]|uniref:Glycosyltransferase RgtA/B/C/D-like domain-containing protein n=1 Tax=Saltatorellus ferox TaxID=2528018 RepID=A0A518EXA9_9BACT|nr:hypothetical protein Poly30_42890 [Planctomycetes bacterium Poly30]
MTGVDSSPSAAPGQTPRRGQLVGLLLLLLVVPLGLRLWPIAHGAPRAAYVPDTHIVKNALNMAKDKNLVPPAGAYSSYPYLLPYTLLPIYAAEYARGRVMGDWAGSGEFGAKLQENPWRAHLLARIVCAVLSASVAIFLFLAARAAGFGVGAWIAGWFGGTSLLHVQMSTHERPWAPLTAMLAATVWGAAVHTRTGSLRSLLLTGVIASMAFSTLPVGGLALLMAGVAWALAPRPEGELLAPARTAFLKRVVRGFACVGLFVALAAVVGYPFYLRYGEGAVTGVAAGDLVTEDMWTIQFGGTQMRVGFSLATLQGLMRTFFGYDPVILVLGALGVFSAFRRRALMPLGAFLLVWGALFLVGVNEQVRYIIPVVVLMAMPAGAFAEALARRPLGRVMVAVLMVLPLVQALRLGYVLRQPDTRAVAEELIARLPAGAMVAIDVYGPVPPQTLGALGTTKRLRERVGSELYGREAHRLMMLEASLEQPQGLPVLRLEDVFEYSLHNGETWIREASSATSPAALDLGETAASALAAMGATHLLLTDRSPENGVLPPLLDPMPPLPLPGRVDPSTGEVLPGGPGRKLAPLELPASPVWTVHPAWSVASVPEDAAPVPDAHLPTTLDFPLLDLWRVRRPGPKLELYELPR